jgi:GAF domain-containing protein
MNPPRPENERERLDAVAQLAVNIGAAAAWDDIVRLASVICETPIAAVSVVDAERQWLMASVGIETGETPRDSAFCAHAILEPDRVMVIPDAADDPFFADNSAVTGDPHVRFYAGMPLRVGEYPFGALCVIDREPRQLRPDQITALTILARIAERQLIAPQALTAV